MGQNRTEKTSWCQIHMRGALLFLGEYGGAIRTVTKQQWFEINEWVSEGDFMGSSHPSSKQSAMSHKPRKTCYMPAEAKVTDADGEPSPPPDFHLRRSASPIRRPARRKQGRRETLQGLDHHGFGLRRDWINFINIQRKWSLEKVQSIYGKKIKICLLPA